MKLKLVFLLSAVLLGVSVLSSKALAQTLYLPHYTTKNGLPSNNCFYTLQDKKGYLWIATDAGVSRFDGNTFENFTVDDGLPDNQILQLKEDKKGRIWFLALNGQLSYFYNGKIHHTGNEPKLKLLNLNAVVVSFFEDSKGRIWFGTNKNIIACWNEESVLKYSSPNPQKQFINAFIHEDAQGNIWAYSSQALHIFIQRDFVLIKDETLPLSYKTSLNLPSREMYFLDQQGLNLKTGLTNKRILNIKSDLLANNPGYIYVDKRELWLGNNSGVYILGFDGSERQILPNIDVNQVIKDRNENMWFTTKNGIYRLPNPNERLYTFTQIDGLANNTVNSIQKDQNNRLWIGLNDAKIDIVNLNNFKTDHVEIPDKKKFYNIKQLVLDSVQKTMYFASDYGLGRFSNIYSQPSINSYLQEKNNSVFVIKDFSIDNENRLALALSSGVLLINDRQRNLKFNALNYKDQYNYFKERSYSVYFDNQKNLWFSNIDGLSEFKNNNLEKYFLTTPLLTKRINDIVELKNGVYALATDGFGIVFLKGKEIIKQLKRADGLTNNIITKLFVKNGYLWAISKNGVNRIKTENNLWQVESFDFAHHLLSDDLNDLYIDDQHAYFATNSGLVYFKSNSSSIPKAPPKVFISFISYNKTILDLGIKNFSFKPEEHNIAINYSAINFNNQQITYRYRLRGESAWTETKNKRLELTNLEPGSYVFEVSAKTQDHNWGEPDTFSFILEKHFWQSWWFITILLSCGGLILYRITVNVTKRQKNKEQEKLMVKNRTLMLEQRALQAMMNPHFVFNVMNSIQHYINTTNTSSANKVLTGFARLIRKNLEICTKSYINLEEEIEYLNLYLSLEKYRFGEKFKYNLWVSPIIDKEETYIPSMLLQPYIENAIWHGIMPKEEGGEVNIRVDLENEHYLKIEISDNGIGIENSLNEKSGGHTSKGMDLTRERINLLNKIEANPIQLSVKQQGKSGTMVKILVPLG